MTVEQLSELLAKFGVPRTVYSLSGAIGPLQERLWENVRAFDAMWPRQEFNSGLRTPIRTIAVGSEVKASDV